MRSRSSFGRDNSSEKEGSDEAACDAAAGVLVDGLRRRTGRLGDCGGGTSSMVVSEEPLLPVEERERDCGVELREAIFCRFRRRRSDSLVGFTVGRVGCASEEIGVVIAGYTMLRR